MTSSRERSILGFVSIATLFFISYLSWRLSSTSGGYVPGASYRDLIATTILSFNMVILFGWIAFGHAAGFALVSVSLVVAFLVVLRTSLYTYGAFTLSFLVTAAVGYGHVKVIERIEQLYMLRLEKTDEDGNLLANTIDEKKKAIQALEDKLSRYSALKEITEDLSTVLSLEAVNNLITEKTSGALGKEGRVLLYLVDAERQELMLSSSKGSGRAKAKKGDVFDQWVLRHRKSIIIEDISKDFRFSTEDIEDARKYFRALIATPIVAEDKVIGILRVDSPESALYAQDDLRLLGFIADLGAVAIQNALLYSRTQELAIKDGLTGLIVRRYFMERFKEEVRRATRRKGTLSILLLDIDHFKEYNDKYGHVAGDLVLKFLGRTIGSMVREGDLLGRFGGEEFAFLLFGADRTQAACEAEMIRKAIEDHPLVLRRERTFITASIGVSTYPNDGVTEEDLMKVADERLYKAKAEGRNRVCAS